MELKRFIKYLLAVILLGSMGCSSMGYAPAITISPSRPIVAKDLSAFSDKRAVLLAVRVPDSERGLDGWFSSLIFSELLAAAPFASVSNHSESVWFGLQSSASEELSTAAHLGRELGADLAIIVEVERFIYGRTANSVLMANFLVLDCSKGELLHSRRVKAEGIVGYIPPFRDVSLNKPVHRDDLFQSVAIDFVKGLWRDWKATETGEEADNYEQTSR